MKMKIIILIFSIISLPLNGRDNYFNTIGETHNSSHKRCRTPEEQYIEGLDTSGLYESFLADTLPSMNEIKNPSTNLKSKSILQYYQGEDKPLNIPNLVDMLFEADLQCKIYVLAQALLETGYFSSRVCRDYNNLFGLYDSKNKDYYRFQRWQDSVIAYHKFIQYRYKGGNYLVFLKRIGYAEDPLYQVKVARMVEVIKANIKKTQI